MTPNTAAEDEWKKGLFYTLLCYVLWGNFPLYWYPIINSPIPADQILAQRVIWSSLFAVIFMLFLHQRHAFWAILKSPKIAILLLCSSAFLSVNWLTYLWAITNDRVLESSLGYFITPLFSILLGRIFFKDPLYPIQMLAIILASTGVIWLAFQGQHIPYIAILLTLSFGIYGLLRKIAPAPALPALTFETLCMLPFALLYLLWCQNENTFVFSELTTLGKGILIGSGIATTIPLLLFAAGAKRISLSQMGIIQYISPTIQFFIGLFVFHEAFDLSRFIGYVLVWIAVIIYVMGSLSKKQGFPHRQKKTA